MTLKNIETIISNADLMLELARLRTTYNSRFDSSEANAKYKRELRLFSCRVKQKEV